MTPSVTLMKVKENIKEVKFFYDGLLTICVLTLQNGFKTIGESACVSEALYSKELGEKLARDRAENKIWELMGYELKCRVDDLNTGTYASRLMAERDSLELRLSKLEHFLASEGVVRIDVNSHELLIVQAEQMKALLTTLNKRCSTLGIK